MTTQTDYAQPLCECGCLMCWDCMHCHCGLDGVEDEDPCEDGHTSCRLANAPCIELPDMIDIDLLAPHGLMLQIYDRPGACFTAYLTSIKFHNACLEG